MLAELLNNRILLGLIVVIGVPAAICGYVMLVERVLRGLRPRTAVKIRPWLWVLPAIAFLTVFLVYPTIATIWRSLFDRRGLKSYMSRQMTPAATADMAIGRKMIDLTATSYLTRSANTAISRPRPTTSAGSTIAHRALLRIAVRFSEFVKNQM